MRTEEWARPYQKIIEDALRALPAERPRTKLYLDTVPYMKDTFIGPEFQGIRAAQNCLLVFADDDPMANFGHRCRYRFYDAKPPHHFLWEVPATFPPHLHFVPKTFRVFHEPVPADPRTVRTPVEISPAPTPAPTPTTPTPTPAPPVTRNRYAILFSGSRERRHLNDLEYCYRMLTKRYLFDPANIFVLYHDNTRTVLDGSTAKNWPTETDAADPYQIPVPESSSAALLAASLQSFKANRKGFQDACNQFKAKLQPGDLVFVHTNGHGNADLVNGQPKYPWMVGHDNLPYTAQEFCDDLAELPAHESLLIVMEQCYSALFIAPVTAAMGFGTKPINASRLSMACASKEFSYSNPQGTFDRFLLGWVTAHLDKDPYGVAPIGPVNTNNNAFIEASEAYVYAKSVAQPCDKPDFADVSVAATSAAAPPSGADIQLTDAVT